MNTLKKMGKKMEKKHLTFVSTDEKREVLEKYT